MQVVAEITHRGKILEESLHPPPSTIPHPFCPSDIEKWALPLFKIAGLQPPTTSTAACINVKCACCQLLDYPGGYEPIKSEPPYLDMYICDVCQQT
eukprot:1142787-Pelagomonas_calceolata.AAC.1